jgi:hypothetical protein
MLINLQETVMLRTSSFLAIALGFAAIGSATVPAAANPLAQKVFGNQSHLAQLPPPAAAAIPKKPLVTQVPHTIPAAPGIASKTPGKIMIPIPTGQTSVSNAQDSCATNPKLCPTPPKPWPPQPWPPIPHCEAMSGPLLQKCLHPTTNNDDDKDKHRNPVVLVLQPPVQVPVQVPVAVPVAPSYAAPARVAASSTSGSAVTAQPQPVVTPACMTAADIPALAAGIDQLLPTAQLSDADKAKITELRQMIQQLATDGKVPAARDIEEAAMNLLGYQKVWLRCGAGTFDWEKIAATATVQQR